MAGLACPARRRLLALLLLSSLAPLPARADFPATVARVKRSVVAVGTYVAIGNPRFRFLGTGFVVGDGNRVVTNAHVVASAPESGDEKLVIAMPGSGPQVVARPVRREASDLDHDLALLGFDGPALPALALGDSNAVREGQDVAITGFPLGGSIGIVPVTHKGIVSAVTPIGQPVASAGQLDGRMVRRLAAGGYPVLQLDIVSYPGNSGSPLYDPETGEVLGILNMVFVKGAKETALTNPSGISYAIPVSFLKALIKP